MTIDSLVEDKLEKNVVDFYYKEIANRIKSKEEYKTILVPHLGKFVYLNRKHFKVNEKKLKNTK